MSRKHIAVLLQYLAQGYSCPRKMLINSEVEIVEVDDDYITKYKYSRGVY